MKKSETLPFSSITLTIICFSLCLLSISISEISLGFIYATDTLSCVPKEVNFSLSTWLSVGGISDILIVFGILLAYVVGHLQGLRDNIYNTILTGALIYSVFLLAWIVIECIIISGISDSCKKDFSEVWTMSIVALVVKGLIVVLSCSQARARVDINIHKQMERG